MDFITAMNIVEEGFRVWREKPHNAKWWRRIDGTPIPNDLAVNIAEAMCRYKSPEIGSEIILTGDFEVTQDPPVGKRK